VSDYYMDVVSRVADLPLFKQRPPAQRHSDTSVAAAASLDVTALNKLQRQVLDYLRTQPAGATDEQIAAALGMNPSTERPRRIELAKRGLVVEAGVKKASSGRNATAWRLA
jgi:hypothetical protein